MFVYVCLLSLQVVGKITTNGIYLEQLETEPWKYMPDIREADLHDDVVKASIVAMVPDHLYSISYRILLYIPRVHLYSDP